MWAKNQWFVESDGGTAGPPEPSNRDGARHLQMASAHCPPPRPDSNTANRRNPACGDNVSSRTESPITTGQPPPPAVTGRSLLVATSATRSQRKEE